MMIIVMMMPGTLHVILYTVQSESCCGALDLEEEDEEAEQIYFMDVIYDRLF